MKPDLRIESLETRRLILRPYVMADAVRLTELLQDPDIYRWTNSIPSPYTIERAREFLELCATADASGESFVWAITGRTDGTMMGAMGLHDVKHDRGRAELGYWIGANYRNRGYTTEAARRVLSWCFEVGELERIQASFMPGNAASRGVMEKIGMRREGLLRGYGFKDGKHFDLYLYAVLRDDPTWISTEEQLA